MSTLIKNTSDNQSNLNYFVTFLFYKVNLGLIILKFSANIQLGNKTYIILTYN